MAQPADRELRRLIESMQRVTTPSFRQQLLRVLGATLRAEVVRGFSLSQNPYGEAWRPLTSRTGKPLLDTGAHLRNRFSTQPTGDGVRLSNNFIGVRVHNFGAVIKPVRAKALRFRTRGAASKGDPRGKWNAFQFRQKVVIPQRQMVPDVERGLGPRFGKALNAAADAFIRPQFPGV